MTDGKLWACDKFPRPSLPWAMSFPGLRELGPENPSSPAPDTQCSGMNNVTPNSRPPRTSGRDLIWK